MAERKRKKQPGYQTLEARRLLAVSANLNGSELILTGDTGANTVVVSRAGDQLVVSGDSNHTFNFDAVSLVRFFGNDGNDTFENTTLIETVAAGQNGDDTLSSVGVARLLGNDGNDILTGGAQADTLIGGRGIDEVFAGGGDDFIVGADGNDRLFGEGGNDRILGGNGNDTLNGGSGDDTVFGFFGVDSIIGGDGADRLFGQGDGDTINGSGGNDVVRGNDGADTLRGGAGNDRLLGDIGDDTILGDDGADTIFGGSGADIARGGSGNDRVFGNQGNDELFGDAGNDTVRGNEGNDELFGGDNADRIVGDDGDDYIEGGLGGDIVFGDAGRDTIVADFGDRATGGAGDDILQLSEQGGDTAVFLGNDSNFVVTQQADVLVVRDTTGAEGLDLVSGAETFAFGDRTRTAEAQVTERVFIQPIIASNDDGSSTATFFGNAEQEFDIKRRIDEIYLQAGVDVEWLDPNEINSTFINFGNGDGTRTSSDLEAIINQGDAAGVGNVDSNVLDFYFVDRVPAFGVQGTSTANGLAFVGGNGIAMHTGDNLPNSENGRSVAARVAAHEIAHNLGLRHVEDPVNLLDAGDQLNSQQIADVLDSRFTCGCPCCAPG